MSSIVLPSASDIEGAIRVASQYSASTAAPEKRQVRRRFTVRTPAGGRSESWIPVEHKEDPRQALMQKVGEVPDGLVLFSRILVAVYIPPLVDKTRGGILLADKIKEEDRLENIWQGKVGLVIKMGERAYVDDDDVKFHGQKVSVGDWVWFRPSEGMGCDVNEVFCRLFDSERYIIGKIPHPDMVA